MNDYIMNDYIPHPLTEMPEEAFIRLSSICCKDSKPAYLRLRKGEEVDKCYQLYPRANFYHASEEDVMEARNKMCSQHGIACHIFCESPEFRVIVHPDNDNDYILIMKYATEI